MPNVGILKASQIPSSGLFNWVLKWFWHAFVKAFFFGQTSFAPTVWTELTSEFAAHKNRPGKKKSRKKKRGKSILDVSIIFFSSENDERCLKAWEGNLSKIPLHRFSMELDTIGLQLIFKVFIKSVFFLTYLTESIHPKIWKDDPINSQLYGRAGMNSTFTWAMQNKSIDVLPKT